MMVRGGGDPRQAWLARRLREWACRLGALPPMRMTASWFGSAWYPPNTSVWRDVPRLMASSPRIIYCPIHSPISHIHRPGTASRPPTAVDGQAQGPPSSGLRKAVQRRAGSAGIASSVSTQTSPGACPGGCTGTSPAPRRQTRGGRCAARGSLLCTTWTSHIVRALSACGGGNTLDS